MINSQVSYFVFYVRQPCLVGLAAEINKTVKLSTYNCNNLSKLYWANTLLPIPQYLVISVCKNLGLETASTSPLQQKIFLSVQTRQKFPFTSTAGVLRKNKLVKISVNMLGNFSRPVTMASQGGRSPP